ncbi:Transcription factor IIA, beta-barrel domain-containing protein [Rozella allomycis CSF55]|uniref:Transcription factor IIA, beta-barrel domain-containing protein n=1 Tax=Rozella allomycis (strain CSF55) TaxID=988480 RepID=A0A075AP92_ROZAC|nr:Transcription factor IIA, beta-barrel domain-containing protein [Rozella allomycis CSF55]|eukprot:EPZ31808.1 Transcription factor IIA, beta-barrel domain-containing protein [Rozella allomycis CSF55]
MNALHETEILYQEIIEDVTKKSRDAFLNAGIDETVLMDMRQLWLNKLTESRVLQASSSFGMTFVEQEQVTEHTKDPDYIPNTALLNEMMGGTSVASMSMSAMAPGLTQASLSKLLGLTKAAAQQSKKAANKSGQIPQRDGASELDEDDDFGFDNDDGVPLDELAPINAGGDDLGSDLDSSDDEEPGTENFIMCQFERVQRTKNRWRCAFKEGILHLNQKEYMFNKMTGDFEW